MPSDDGIAFYNKQPFTSVTPVWDFQNRIAADPQGQRAVKLYQFNATTVDWAELTITTVLQTIGAPDLALVHTCHRRRDHLDARPRATDWAGRSPGLVGMDQDRINQKVYEGSIGRVSPADPGAKHSRKPRSESHGETIERNADLRARGLVGRQHPRGQ